MDKKLDELKNERI